MSKQVKPLGIFALVMITVGAVASVRNLPTLALFGSQLIIFFVLGALFFLLPSALVAAELASSSEEKGGIYVWVKHAFGEYTGFVAVWFQWVENFIWYPMILAFIAGIIGYMISPTLGDNKYFIITVILIVFWGATIINLYGIKLSARFASFCTIAGLLIPIGLIIIFGIIWVLSGKPLQIDPYHHSWTVNFSHMASWSALTAIILSFGGMEVATVHAADVRNPQRDFPYAMLLATLLILAVLLLGSLSIAMTVPAQDISLLSGMMAAFQIFLHQYHLYGLLPVLGGLLVIGGVGGVNNWIIAPTRGLQLAAVDGNMPCIFQYQNAHRAPGPLLLMQGLVVSLVSLVFFIFPTVNASYWFLTVLAAQVYMVMYILMFLSVLRLRYKHKAKVDGYRVPGGKVGIFFIAGLGLCSCVVTFFMGFFPPAGINVGNVWHFELLLFLSLGVTFVLPFLLSSFSRRKLEE